MAEQSISKTKRVCQVEGCDRKYHAKGFCKFHYGQMHKWGEIRPLKPHKTQCIVKECERKHYAKGYCLRHYLQIQKHGRIFGNPKKPKYNTEPFVSGQAFGRWTLIKQANRNKQGRSRWLCRCTCGIVRKVTTSSLRFGSSKSCGCLQKGQVSIANSGTNHANWKGDQVGYNALHAWVRKHKPKPAFCERCKKNLPQEVSNNSGEYKRDINDYEWLCRSCHWKKDGIGKKLKLSKYQVHRIREFYRIGAGFYKELGRLFHVDAKTIGNVINAIGYQR